MITTILIWCAVILINAIVLGLVPEKRSPSSAMAWLLLILLVPVFGLLVYLLIGSPYVPRKRREEQLAVAAIETAAALVERQIDESCPKARSPAQVLNLAARAFGSILEQSNFAKGCPRRAWGLLSARS